MTKRLFMALEEDSSGLTKHENERTFYAVLKSADFLKSAADTAEKHEQWEIRIPKTDNNLTGGRVRVRRTETAAGQVEYVQTIKINRTGSEVGNTQVDETSFPVTEAVFEQFRLLASNGMVKTRYTFFVQSEDQGTDASLPDTASQRKKIEVDVFRLPTGEIGNWVKIDYEYADGEPSAPASFPPGFEGIIAGDSPDAADQAHIRMLYQDLFLAKRGA